MNIGGSITNKNNFYILNKDIDFDFNDDEDNWEKFLDWKSDELEFIYNNLKKELLILICKVYSILNY